ncbi:MAG: hypothetical protein HQK65_10950 [Desulfamplus sp.]|nr:hypothetical protein [Desulfamplus sp.]
MSIAPNVEDINIATENGNINIQTKSGSKKDINIEARNIKTKVRERSLMWTGGPAYSIKSGCLNNAFVGSTNELYFGTKFNVDFGSAMAVGVSSVFSQNWGPEHEDSTDDWNKHSSKSIVIDAENSITLVGGSKNNSKISGDAQTLSIAYGTDQGSSASDHWVRFAMLSLLSCIGGAMASWLVLDDTDSGDEIDLEKGVPSVLVFLLSGLVAALYKPSVTSFSLGGETTTSEVELSDTSLKLWAAKKDECTIELGTGINIITTNGKIYIEAKDIELKGNVTIQGDLKATKDLNVTGNLEVKKGAVIKEKVQGGGVNLKVIK